MNEFYKELSNYEKSNIGNCIQVGIKDLKKYLGASVCITANNSKKNEYTVSEDKLRDGEISAIMYSVGCYKIKESVMLYKNDETVSYTERVPAEQELVAKCRGKGYSDLLIDDTKHRTVREISVAHTGSSHLKWNFVCLLIKDDLLHLYDKRRFIGTIKDNIFSSEKSNDLLIYVTCTSQKYWSGSWYRISADGKVKKYPIPYDENYSEIKYHKKHFSKHKRSVIEPNMVLENAINEIFSYNNDMKAFLCEHKSELSKHQITDMIVSSVMSLETKQKLFEQLSETENLAAEIAANPHNIDFIIENSYITHAMRIQEAIKELYNSVDSVFMSYTHRWVENKFETESKIVYDSGAAAIYNTDWGHTFAPSPFKMLRCFADRLWYTIEKCQKNGYSYDNTYQYILMNGFVPYFQCEKNGFKVHPNPNLNLPVPFKSGDIITVCNEPFASEKHALILDVGNNIDCDCVKILYVTSGGVIKVNSLKHGYIFEDENSEMYTSPLYNLKIFDGELTGNDEILMKIQNYMNEKKYKSWGGCEILRNFDGKNVKKINFLH